MLLTQESLSENMDAVRRKFEVSNSHSLILILNHYKTLNNSRKTF